MHLNGNIAGGLVELSKNQPMEVSMYYIAQRWLGWSAIADSRKQMACRSGDPEHAAKGAHAGSGSVGGALLSAAQYAKDENVIVDIFSEDIQQPATNRDIALIECEPKQYCCLC